MKWFDVSDNGYPQNGEYVLISIDGFVGIAQYIDDDWETVGSNRKHFIFKSKQRSYSSCQPQYWAHLPDGKEDE